MLNLRNCQNILGGLSRLIAASSCTCKIRKLSKEGLKIEFESMLAENTKNVQVAPKTGIGKAIEVVNCAIKKVNHALCRGKVFGKSEP